MKSIAENTARRRGKRATLFSIRCWKRSWTSCPADVWQDVFNEIPFWYQVYHNRLLRVDYWFREDPAGTGFPSARFDPRIPGGVCIGRCQRVDIFPARRLRVYLRLIRQKLLRIFAAMIDGDLSQPAFGGRNRCDSAGRIFFAARHIMYNVGYCNGILRERDLEEADWFAYNEPEE
jgi:hypothetical protein